MPSDPPRRSSELRPECERSVDGWPAQAKRSAPARDPELGEDEGGHLADSMAARVSVKRGEHRRGPEAGRGERADRAAQLAHRRRRRDPPADDITHDEPDGHPLIEPEDVVPVAAHLSPLTAARVGDVELQPGCDRAAPRTAGCAAAARPSHALAGGRAAAPARSGAGRWRRRSSCGSPRGRSASSRLRTELIRAGSSDPSARSDLDRDLPHRALHLQQRRVVRLVVDPAPRREQILKAHSARRSSRARPVHDSNVRLTWMMVPSSRVEI